MKQYNISDTVIGSDGYYRVVADGVKGMRLQFDRPFIPGEIVRGDFGDVVQTPQDAPKTHEVKRVVLVHLDGYLETDGEWLANQDKLDYAATVHAASYRGQ